MKKITKTPFIILVALLLFAGNAFTSSNGISSPLSGSPLSNGQTCSNCHGGGNSSAQTISIVTDIPASGYEPNTLYTIKIKAQGNGGTATRGGFNATIEQPGGFAGTLSQVNGGKSKVNGNSVTHLGNSNQFSGDSLVWKFLWNSSTAPSATIYTAVNFANGNGNTTGDAVKSASLQLSKSVLSLNEESVNGLAIYPNPAKDVIRVGLQLNKLSFVNAKLYDQNGRVTAVLFDNYAAAGNFDESLAIPHVAAGTYYLLITAGEQTHAESLIIQ